VHCTKHMVIRQQIIEAERLGRPTNAAHRLGVTAYLDLRIHHTAAWPSPCHERRVHRRLSCVDPKMRGPSPRRVLTRYAPDPRRNLWSRRVNRHAQARVRYVRPRGRARRGAFGAAGRTRVLRRAWGDSQRVRALDHAVWALSADSPTTFRTDRSRPRPARRLGRAPVTGALSQAGGAWSPAGQRSRSMISSAVAGTIARVIHPSRWGRRRRGGWIGGRGFGEELTGSASTWVRRRR
jgi:hypothetical protein